MSNGTTTDLTSMLGKPITSGSYKTLRAIREGTGSTIVKSTSIGEMLSRVTDTKSSLGSFATNALTGN
ncbi:hypothetical protein ACM3BL_09825 [Mammaliicoccus sciuri]|uniref:hypothetical protein n=1 Tax=Mammaliicoccus sciuri TaxID=1296 RepID=UPI000734E0DB|nr:hypothetical protein [Mammaliicoccus sciuri]KTT79815.1 hypothetical protein NS202_11790 [Mammaliicoccus sciuri]